MLGELLGFAGSLFGASEASSASSDATAAYRAASAEQTALAREELARINEVRNKALAGTDNLAATLQAAMVALGPFGGSYFNEAELAGKQGQLYRQYSDDADRAVTKAASLLQSDLIKAGMDGDRTTLKADVAREFAPVAAKMYDTAYTQSFADALSYISGVNTERYRGQDQMDTRRSRSLAEIDTVLGRPVQYQSSLIGNTAVPASLMSGATSTAASSANTNAVMATQAGQGLGYSIGKLGTAVEKSDVGKRVADWASNILG